MKQKIKRIAAACVCAAVLAGIAGAYGWHRHQMNTLQTELTAEYEKEKRLEDRIAAIRAENNALGQQNQAQSGQISSLNQTIDDLEIEFRQTE